MRNFIFSLAAVFSTVATTTAQTLVFDDFEGNGTLSWQADACNININKGNPFVQGINTSATVLEYHDVGGQYANIFFNVANPFDLTVNRTFTLKIYVPSSGLTGSQPNQISLKLQNGTIGQPWTTQSEIIKPIILNQWQTITFDFLNDPYINFDPASLPPTQRTDFTRVLLQVNGENNTDHVLAFIDDVSYDGTILADPVFTNLVWSDEFNGSGMIDTSKWFHQTQLPNGGSWYNGEIQHYTNRTDNSIVSNGHLSIIAKREVFTDQGHTKQFTSARLNSKFAFTYGRVEVRAKLPTGVGTWPAIWMLGTNIIETGLYWTLQGNGTVYWPYCGEIDIMEHWGNNQNFVQSAMHTPSSFGNTVNHGGRIVPTASTDFHVYAVDWSETKMVFSVDGVVHYTYNPPVRDANTWPFDDDQFILLNIAIEPSIAPSFIQSAMEIDYVRVYQQSQVSVPEAEPMKHATHFPNPVIDKFTIQFNQPITETVLLRMYHIDGRLVRTNQAKVENNQIILNNLGDLKSGVYVVVYEINNQAYRIKMMKY